MDANKGVNEREFLFERKHWNMLLRKLAPSLQLKVKQHIRFKETVIVFGPDNEDRSVERSLSLDLSLKRGSEHLVRYNQAEIKLMEKEIGVALISTLADLRAFPKGATNNGKLIQPEESDRSSGESDSCLGFVYLIRNQDLFKIGITLDLKRRMEELKPDEIVNTIKCKNFRDVEKDLHSLFRNERLPQTEYFRLDQEQVQRIQSLMVKLAEF
ncbi:GIY-YIG nuclease family protein [Vulcanococcus sp. Clear-D1]|jgi:hypothetical protein|uniref:GIY-YIG nuclease family protein n=1 Tax=Vulcanococcus sp. Clear-D1 TaxID=2766970 RepID=UPI0019B06C2E|nr:GIY-YIG nuclease family protein [Vulcanococcus sp. Clear-D1]MBD1192869.1 GIY-YIG nuclease family protein [Vulcanococcus sp. Clear-D1]